MQQAERDSIATAAPVAGAEGAIRGATGKGVSFWQFHPDGRQLFSVNAGVPVDYALEQASCLLSVARDMTHMLGLLSDDQLSPDGEIDVRQSAWAASYLTEMAKAVIDAALVGSPNLQSGGQ